jgi:hypothetical protein
MWSETCGAELALGPGPPDAKSEREQSKLPVKSFIFMICIYKVPLLAECSRLRNVKFL